MPPAHTGPQPPAPFMTQSEYFRLPRRPSTPRDAAASEAPTRPPSSQRSAVVGPELWTRRGQGRDGRQLRLLQVSSTTPLLDASLLPAFLRQDPSNQYTTKLMASTSKPLAMGIRSGGGGEALFATFKRVRFSSRSDQSLPPPPPQLLVTFPR